MRGDPVFYGPFHGQLHAASGAPVADRLVSLGEELLASTPAAAQAAPRVTHVAVQVDDVATNPLVIEAVPPLISCDIHAGGEIITGWAQRYDPDRLEAALKWLADQLDQPYGWADVAAEVCAVLRLPLEVFEARTLDCSHLTVAFLTQAGETWDTSGYPGAADWVAAPQLVTPADLYGYTHFHLRKEAADGGAHH